VVPLEGLRYILAAPIAAMSPESALEQRTEPRVDALEQSTIARVSARLVPFLVVCYFVAYLDRVNVSFAALTMNRDLGLSASQYEIGRASCRERV